MFPSGDVHILTQSGMSDGLKDLETPQDFNGVGRQREAIATTNIMRES